MSQRWEIRLEVGDRPINLTQALKLANCVQSGGEAKSLIAAEAVRVNGELEIRKRRRMVVGDVIDVEDGPRIILA